MSGEVDTTRYCVRLLRANVVMGERIVTGWHTVAETLDTANGWAGEWCSQPGETVEIEYVDGP